jgi:hypothetical protein
MGHVGLESAAAGEVRGGLGEITIVVDDQQGGWHCVSLMGDGKSA